MGGLFYKLNSHSFTTRNTLTSWGGVVLITGAMMKIQLYGSGGVHFGGISPVL